MPLPSPPTSGSGFPADGDLSGRQLGDFRLLRRLGHGAMAEVYLAEQERLKRRVAVKILKPELADDRTYLQRFELEAQAAASLVHANIVQIYEVGCIDQLHYIAQEYVHGQNLRDYLSRHGLPDLSHALSIIRQVASALAKAAERGVIHRDIKPENIMLTAGGEVKVADFGLARLTRGDAANDLTQIGITLGTPLYMSPEQVEGKPLDPRSDIYSFGVTCYQMLSGAPPFTGETALGVAVQHLKSRPQPLESLRPDLPPALCRIVHQMLAKNPGERFHSARELLRELRRVQMEHFGDDWPEDLPAWESLAADVPDDPRIVATRRLGELMKTTARRKTTRRYWGLLAAAAFALGGVAGWRMFVAEPLLADAKTELRVRRESSVERQCYRASQIGTEAAWQSVIDNFPDRKSYVLRAKQQLSLIYLRKEDYKRAMTIFDELASLGEDHPELAAFGLAGQCGVLSLRGQWDQSDALLRRLWSVRDRLDNKQMKRLLEYAIDRNRSNLGQQTAREWDDWLAEQFREGN
ncbi:MAG: serine/threonine protein kinase [Pirellulales bacterium]|nr:serine/threonine protein kinase [Pirellulales bacterium]